MEDGKVPDRWFIVKSIEVAALKLPKEVGRGPVRLFVVRFNWFTRPNLHSTPAQVAAGAKVAQFVLITQPFPLVLL